MSPPSPTQPSPKELQRLREQEKQRRQDYLLRMQVRVLAELRLTLVHVRCAEMLSMYLAHDLCQLADELEETIEVLREQSRDLNDPDEVIRRLRLIRKQYRLPRHHEARLQECVEQLFSQDVPGSDEADAPADTSDMTHTAEQAPRERSLVELAQYRASLQPGAWGAGVEQAGGRDAHEGPGDSSSIYTSESGKTNLKCINSARMSPDTRARTPAPLLLPHPQYAHQHSQDRIHAMVDDLLKAASRLDPTLTPEQLHRLNAMSYTVAEFVAATDDSLR